MKTSVNPARQMSTFRIIVLCLSSGLFFYVAHQLTRFSDFSTWQKLFIIFVLALPFAAVLSMPLFFWSMDRHNLKPWQKLWTKFAELSIAYLNFILFLVVIRDLLGFALSLLNKDDMRLYATGVSTSLLFLPLLMIVVGILPIIWGPKIIHRKIRVRGLPKALDGLRIAQISDLHISNSATASHLRRVFQKTSDLHADIVVLTGDIIDGNADDHTEWIQQLGTFKSKYGTYYCTGNHEYYWNIEKCLAALKKTSVKTLLNEAITISINNTAVSVAGVMDPAARMFNEEGPNWEKIKAFLPEESFKILLCHQPFLADEACQLGYQLQLSGHTHNGQFFPWNLLIRFFQKYAKGEYRIKNMSLYVNQGTGYWGPAVRLGTHCEISLLEIYAE